MRQTPPELLAFCFEFLGWQRVRAHCTLVCKRWRQASDEYIHSNVLLLTDDMSGWQVCTSVYTTNRAHVVLRSNLQFQEWPMKLMHLTLETLELVRPRLSSLHIGMETSCVGVDCEALLRRITVLLPVRYDALRVWLPMGFIPAPTFLAFATGVTAYPVGILSLSLYTTDIKQVLPGWRRLLGHYVVNAIELTVDCPNLSTTIVVTCALADVDLSAGVVPLYRLCLHFHGERTGPLMSPLWAMLTTMREGKAPRLREIDLAFRNFVFQSCGLEDYRPATNIVRILDHVRLDFSGSVVCVKSLWALLGLLGRTRRMDLHLGDNSLLPDIWSTYLPLAASLCDQRLSVHARPAWIIDAAMAEFLNTCRGRGLVVSLIARR